MHPEVLLELGAVVLGLSILARLAGAMGIPSIPLFLLAGLAFGRGGLIPLVTTNEFVEIGAGIGLVLLLFVLGLEYTAAELVDTLKGSWTSGVVNFALNFVPGLAAGLLLGWDPVAAVALAGVTYAASSGIIAKLLSDADRFGNRETPIILSLLVFEDLTIAVYLPVLGALLLGGSALGSALSIVVAIVAVIGLLALALRVEVGLSRLIFSHSDEALLLTLVGMALVVAGAAELLQVSAAVGALLLGIMLSGPAAENARGLLEPLRDLFAALFFVFFGLTVDPATIPPVFVPAFALATVTGATKFTAGWVAARRAGVGVRGAIRAGATLVPRGEFSIAVAGVGVAAGIEPQLGPLAAAYVLVLAVLGPLVFRVVDPITDWALAHAGR